MDTLMDVVFTDADQFERITGTLFPHVVGDIIGLITTPHKAQTLRELQAGIEAEEFTKYFIDPSDLEYIILNPQHKPKYSNTDFLFNGIYPIPLSIKIQNKLQQTIEKDTSEASGLLTTDGIINYSNGNEKTAPKQINMDEVIGFHTHPKVAYTSHKTNVGWPSRTDTKLETNKHLIFCVEGIYFITQPTTCFVPSKSYKTFSSTETQKIAKKCSWILLPWNTEWWFY